MSLAATPRAGLVDPERDFRLSPSCLARCQRELARRALGWREPPPVADDESPGDGFDRATWGTLIGDAIERRAAERLGWRRQVPLELRTPGGRVVKGTADLVVARDAVIDLKCCWASTWSKYRKQPNPEHVAQVITYATAAGIGEGRLIYMPIHKPDAAFAEWRFDPDPKVLAHYLARLDRIADEIENAHDFGAVDSALDCDSSDPWPCRCSSLLPPPVAAPR